MMNERTNPNRASASIRPMPMNIVPRTMPVTSTFVWAIRATTCVTTPSMYSSLGSMLLRHRTGDVRRGEDGEDERLQAGNEDLERDHHGSHAERDESQHVRRAREQGQRPQEEHRQQEVA